MEMTQLDSRQGNVGELTKVREITRKNIVRENCISNFTFGTVPVF